ncbi:hypothetical protein [uncultured Nocardioides sp.]|uniref:hypothetical protein n=1 Tax=uncultured Nocardioides sp. TaxID=198441 RepID=UPI00260C775E|nr:hypothetical protein [uncultured Nocardioides sp.]
MLYRRAPENVQPPRGGPSGALAMVLVLAVVIAIWLLAGRDPGSQTGDPDLPRMSPTTSSPTGTATP